MTDQITDEISQLRSMLQRSDKLITSLRTRIAELGADYIPEDLWADTRQTLQECMDTRGQIVQALAKRTAA